MNKGKATPNILALQGVLFTLEFEMAFKRQDINYQTEPLIAYRKALVEHMAGKVKERTHGKRSVSSKNGA